MDDQTLIVRRPGRAPAQIELRQGDITRVSVDAIVNAANSALAGGGGVDGAIHRAAGPELMTELRRRYSSCPTGGAVITGSGRLAEHGVRWVIHAVGPIWRGGGHGERDLLVSAYRTALRLADEAGARTVAFPAISCGVYAYPLSQGSKVALEAVRDGLMDARTVDQCIFVLYGRETHDAFAAALADLGRAP
jgi:O-acetyl-ADP-ribose deacetylase (regulator of RNase III)